MKTSGLASVLLGAGSTLPRCYASSDAPSVYTDREIITVCKADQDFPRHSEATIIELEDSSLLIAWQRFEESKFGSGDQAPSTIPLMNSSDGGRTWGNLRIVAERQDETSANVYSPNFLRLRNGEILLCYKEYNQLTPGLPQLATAYTIRSQDEGKTFSPPEPIWERQPFGFSNSCIKRLSSGRVVLPICHSDGEMWKPTEKKHVRVFYSDDDCKTWVFGEKKISLPMRGAMEPFIAELQDGRLIMVMRNQLGSLFKSYSADQGESWSLPQTTGLSIPESCPYVTNIPNSDKIMVIWNNAEYNMHWRSHYGKRSPLTAAISADGGVTFTDFWDIETDPNTAFSNPGITWTRDGVCLLTYWVCPYKENWVLSGLIDLRLARFRVRG
ncbi:MAG: glycoside hydrolase [Planctomycetaceae bacterium]|nr:glycoside hydrolase [Planctomycetaceae bacterium]